MGPVAPRRLPALAGLACGDDRRPRVGSPRDNKRGKDRDRSRFTTGAVRPEHDRRHLTLPRLGTVRTHENTRKIERLVASGRARILSVTLSRRGTRIVAAVKLAASRPRQPGVAGPSPVVAVEVGTRRSATVATAAQVIAVVDDPKALERRLQELRGFHRRRSRRTSGSSRHRETAKKLTRL